MTLLIFILIFLYFLIVLLTIRKILLYTGFNKSQKKINILMTIILPVIWSLIIFVMTGSDASIVELKNMRDNDKKDLHSNESHNIYG